MKVLPGFFSSVFSSLFPTWRAFFVWLNLRHPFPWVPSPWLQRYNTRQVVGATQNTRGLFLLLT